MYFTRNPRFKLGQILATPGALAVLEKAGVQPVSLLARHQSGDWGELCKEDREMNEQAIQNERDKDKRQRVMSVYLVGSEKVYLITEHDRSVSTLLLPSDY